ncbi:MAG: hypothetical protein R3275_08035 [Saprospiraceae bacterium]|nr:hypothetical protein [Saprospiraceae bacterium]
MKTNYFSLFTLVLLSGLLFACNSPGSSNEESAEEETTEDTVAQEEKTEKVASPRTAIIITHEVEDYDTWKEAYDEHASAREEANISEWALLRGRDNPNMVTVIGKVGDMEAAKEFTKSEDLKSKMESAGVIGKPNIRFGKVEVIDQEAGKSSDVRLYVRHKVEDYEAWKEFFDSKSDMHEEAGVSPVAVARDVENMNDVTVVLTATDFETLEKFKNNPDLKEAMKNAGVVGEPTFTFMNIQSLQF